LDGLRLRVDLSALLSDVLNHLSGQLGGASWAQTDEVLGFEFMQVEHVGIVQNPNKKEN
jgi:hypothetical protein